MASDMISNRLTQILAIAGTILGLISTTSEIYSRIHDSRNQEIAELHRYELEVFNIVEAAAATKNIGQQRAALSFVNSLEDSDLKTSLSAQLVGSGFAKKTYIGEKAVLTESQIFKKFDATDTRRDPPFGVEQMATIVRKLKMRFYWCSLRQPYDDKHSDASTRRAVALEISSQLFGPAGLVLVEELPAAENIKPEFGVKGNYIRYKK